MMCQGVRQNLRFATLLLLPMAWLVSTPPASAVGNSLFPPGRTGFNEA